jgi:hypothetical protein
MRLGGDDLSSGESKFLHKRKLKEGGEWMRRRIVSLPTPFIGWRREGRRCRGGETPTTSGVLQCFHFEKRGRGNTRFRRGKKHVRRLLVHARRGDRKMQRHDGSRSQATFGLTLS